MTRVTRLLNSYLVVVMLLSLLSASRAHAQTPGPISLVTPLALNPASPGVNVSTQATFTVKNTGGQAITVQAFLVGARDPNNANVDFPGTGQVTLQPGQTYSYSASRSFATAGPNYTAWPVWWDGTNWFELDVHTTFTVGNTTPGTISLVTPLALNPASPGVNVSTQATFTVKNTGGQAITVQAFLVGARDPNNANVDFPGTGQVTLQPGQTYSYSASRSFATAGPNYSAWPVWWDGTNWFELDVHTTFTVGNTTPGTISLVTPLALNPASPGVNVSTQATFTVKNTGGQAVTAQLFVVGARDPNNANVDFAYIGPVTLQPEQQYTYSASRSFSGTGTYSDWPAYYDGTNWIELAPHTSFTVTSGTGGAACNLPWGGTIPDGGSVTAYQSSSVSCGNTCTAQTRTCTNGTLSGSYTNSSCTAPTSCTTTTLTVAKDGTGQYSTISDAAAHAQPGYEIVIKAGTYNEQVAPSVSGTESAYITFRAEQSGTAVISYGGGACIKVSNVNYLKFIGLKLANCNAKAEADAVGDDFSASGALHIKGPAHHIVADGLVVTNSTGSGVYMIGFGWGVLHDITVQNSTVSHSNAHGVFVYRAVDHITVDNNTISYSGNGNANAFMHGLEIVSWDGNVATDGGREPDYIFVTNNEVGYSSVQGAQTWNVTHILFQNNYFHHSGATGIQIESGTHFSILDGNRLEHNSWTGLWPSETGIWIDRSTDCVVRNNRSTSNNIGIWIGGGNDRVIARNNISYLNDGSNTHDYPEGLRVNGDSAKTSSTNVMVVHNTMYKNGNNNGNSYNLVLADFTSTNVARNNIVSDVVGSTNVSADSSYTVSNGCYWNPAVSVPADSAAIRQDPQYVNAASGDFHLQAGSACIDKGAFLTTTTGAGSGTSVTVADGRYFSDGYGITPGDLIMVGGSTATITQVSGNTLTLDRSITWSAGAAVSYPYLGLRPDIGALESQ